MILSSEHVPCQVTALPGLQQLSPEAEHGPQEGNHLCFHIPPVCGLTEETEAAQLGAPTRQCCQVW